MPTPNIYVCFRVHNTTGQIIAAFKNVRYERIQSMPDITTVIGTCFDDVEHIDRCLDWILNETRPAHKDEFKQLLTLLKLIYEVEMQGMKAYIRPARSLEDRSVA